MNYKHMLVAAAAIAGWTQSAAAQTNVETETVTVWGVRQDEIGRAFSASEGEVLFGDFAERPLLRVGELAEVVPGLAATQHSGTGKANQYFLRGFNLDHGTDFSISLDGVPINLRTHAHGQGYLDINGFIPEIMESIHYAKGPYTVDAGDFSAAGHAAFRAFEVLPRNFVQGEIGENNWRRVVGGLNFGGGLGYAALDYTTDDGPWIHPENLEKINGFIRLNLGDVSLSLSAYDASWDSTDQAPLRAIQSGLIDRLDSIDDTVGGETRRIIANAAYDNDAGLTANLYAQDYELNLWSNFTYFLSDPVNGDQFEQAEARAIYGGAAAYAFASAGAWTPRIGAEVRYDDIGPIGLYQNIARARMGTVREDSVEQFSAAIWGDVSGALGPWRVNLGLRADTMDVDVSSDNPLNSGEADDAILSPKASLAYRAAEGLEFYASAGRSYHSNDARGGTITIDPATGDAADAVPLLVPATGVEAGARYQAGAFSGSAALWALDLDSELVYVGDAGATEASDASRRYGVEALGTWSPTSWLTLDAAVAVTHAKFQNVPSGLDHIPLAPEYAVSGGATFRFSAVWTGSVTVRRIGPAPLVEDDSVRSGASTTVNGRLAYDFGPFVLALEALNLFDGDDADIAYFYESRLPGEPAEGVEDVHLHPIPPRAIRLQLRAQL